MLRQKTEAENLRRPPLLPVERCECTNVYITVQASGFCPWGVNPSVNQSIYVNLFPVFEYAIVKI